MSHTDVPRPPGVLFKAASHGQVGRGEATDPLSSARMHLQPRGEGYDRAADMVELLYNTLPPAGEDHEAQVVLLESNAAHIDPAVAELIESRGHVLSLHGGGTTDCKSVNDTNLNATIKAHWV